MAIETDEADHARGVGGRICIMTDRDGCLDTGAQHYVIGVPGGYIAYDSVRLIAHTTQTRLRGEQQQQQSASVEA